MASGILQESGHASIEQIISPDGGAGKSIAV
jgi:hypothetical protein